MWRVFHGYPSGSAGWALLTLRLGAALVVVAGYLSFDTDWLHPWLAIVVGLAAFLLLLGLGTQLAALGLAILAVAIGLRLTGCRGAIIGLQALNFVAVALLGAGAYSIDSYLFGRHVINLDR